MNRPVLRVLIKNSLVSENQNVRISVLSIKRMLLALAVLVNLLVGTTPAQDQTIGLFTYDSAAYEGYTLWSPQRHSSTFLIDMYGRLVHSWASEHPPGHRFTYWKTAVFFALGGWQMAAA